MSSKSYQDFKRACERMTQSPDAFLWILYSFTVFALFALNLINLWGVFVGAVGSIIGGWQTGIHLNEKDQLEFWRGNN